MLLVGSASVVLSLLGGCGGDAAVDGGLDPVDAPRDTGADTSIALDTPADLDAPGEADAPLSTDAPAPLDAPSGSDAPASMGSCDARRVLCDGIPPVCAEGEAPSVSGSCWGPCIPAMMCTCTTTEECPDIRGYSEVCYTRGVCGPLL